MLQILLNRALFWPQFCCDKLDIIEGLAHTRSMSEKQIKPNNNIYYASTHIILSFTIKGKWCKTPLNRYINPVETR